MNMALLLPLLSFEDAGYSGSPGDGPSYSAIVLCVCVISAAVLLILDLLFGR